MAQKPTKPQGLSGPIRVGAGTTWEVIPFPNDKEEMEALIANLFLGSFVRYVARQSEPSLSPFSDLKRNDESDLDFTVQTSEGAKLLELAEFAPLQSHGPTFASAPKALDPKEKAALALNAIMAKSAHQGGAGRLLLLYATEHGFWLDPMTVERLRRSLVVKPPNFDRVYYISVHSLEEGSTTEIYPGTPHHHFGELSNEQLDRIRVTLPHPTEFERRQIFEGRLGLLWGRNRIEARFHLNVPDVGPLRPTRGRHAE